MVRWSTKVCEYLKPDGTWQDYPDEWDVMANGRRIGNDEEQAMEKAKELFAKLEKYGFEYKLADRSSKIKLWIFIKST